VYIFFFSSVFITLHLPSFHLVFIKSFIPLFTFLLSRQGERSSTIPPGLESPFESATARTRGRSFGLSVLGARGDEKPRKMPKVEVTLNFEFHRFHVLFLRSVRRDLASKVATATISGACIRAMVHGKIHFCLKT
jgi:hypothetical protein